MEKFKVDGDVLAASLECPVCFNVPRDLPIPQCPSGHIVCKDCRRSLRECPTCRRRLFADNNSSIAAFLIDHIPHKCKFNEFGCEEKGFLSDIKIHEKKCPERTVKCPVNPNDVVQLKLFAEHAKKKYEPFSETNSSVSGFTSPLSTDYLEWDGISKLRGHEFDWHNDIAPHCVSVLQMDKRFYVYTRYNSRKNRTFLFCVMMAEEQEEAQNYLATIEVFHVASKMSTSMSYPVLPIEDFPDYLDTIDYPRIWKIPYDTMKNLLTMEEIESENKSEEQSKNWSVGYQWKVTIKKTRSPR